MMKNSFLSYLAVFCFIWIPYRIMAQDANELKVPEGTSWFLLGDDSEEGNIQCIALNYNGLVYYACNNAIGCLGDAKQIEMPSRFRVRSMCWTNDNNLILYSNDTLYVLNEELSLHPLLSVTASKLVLQPIGEKDFAFCVANDTVLYRYFTKSDSLTVVTSLDNPIRDFVVDDEDYYIAYGNRVVVFSQEKRLFPILMDEEPITNLAFCGSQSFLFSTPTSLWCVNDKREKELLINQPIIDMMSDDYDRAFFMLQDGTWIFLYPISTYETGQE